MFSFLGTIFGKIASAIASVFVAVGLVSAPASVAPQPIAPDEIPVEIQASETEPISTEPEVDVKAELDALKKQLADEQKKRKELEKKVLAPALKPAPTPAPVSVVATPPPAPAPVVTAPTPTPAVPAIQLLPGQFMTPSGAIVDSTGKVVKAAPIPATTPSTASPSSTSGQATTTPTPPPPAPVWPPAEGSTVDIQRSVFSVINFNNHLTCDQLISLPASKKDLCKLYKEKQSQYTWNIIEDL